MPVDTPLNADSRVITSPEKQGAVAWPLPIEAKLEALLRRTEEVGERTSRKRSSRRSITAADNDGENMSMLLRSYRTITVRELLGGSEDENVIPITERRKPGQWPRQSSS